MKRRFMRQLEKPASLASKIDKFRELASVLPGAAYQTDLQGSVTFVSPNGFQMFGYSAQDAKEPRLLSDLFIQEDRERLKNHLDIILQGNAIHPASYVALRKDGQTFSVIVYGSPLIEDGRRWGSVGLIVDLSYKKRIEKILRETKEKYQDIFENIWDVWCYHDLEGNFLEGNFAFKKQFDFQTSEGRFLNLRDLIAEPYRPNVDDYLSRIRKNGKDSGIMRVVGKDGIEYLFEYSNILFYEDGRPVGVRGMARDVTLRVRAEKSLKKSEERYRSVFENAGLPMVIIEESLIIFMVNERFVEMSGYEKSAIEGKMTLMDFIGAESRDEIRRCLSRRKEDKPFEYEGCITHRQGKQFDVLIRMGRIPEAGQFTASFTDITSRKQAEAALRESREFLQEENLRLRSSIRERYRFCDIIGKSRAMQEVYEFILKAAATQASIIIYGESGTGKELVAKAIHETSDRKNKKFVTVHCGAIPESLMESEFFGYKKGAFTGANEDRRGYLDDADGGTLFLDEVGDVGLSMQVKLLRAIAGDGYAPVGSSAMKNVNVRIIAATNRNIRDLVRKELMREDFFYRIHILPIYLPPLRERKDDLPLLIDHFLHLYDANHQALPGHIMEMLIEYHWPGNIRELQNVLRRYLTLKKLDFESFPSNQNFQLKSNFARENHLGRHVLAPGVSAEDLTLSFPEQNNRQIEKECKLTLENLEKNRILKALAENNWRRENAAQSLGMNRKTLYRKMQKLGLASSVSSQLSQNGT